MEIRNIINLLNAGKIPQAQQNKLLNNQSFEKLVKGFQVLADEKILFVGKEGEAKQEINFSILNADMLDKLEKNDCSTDDNLQTMSEKKLYKQKLVNNLVLQLLQGNQEMNRGSFKTNLESNSENIDSNICEIKNDVKLSDESLNTDSKVSKSIRDMWFINENSNDKDLEVSSKLDLNMSILQNIITSLINESPMHMEDNGLNNDITVLNGTNAITSYFSDGSYNFEPNIPKIKQSINNALSELLGNLSNSYSKKNSDFILSTEKAIQRFTIGEDENISSELKNIIYKISGGMNNEFQQVIGSTDESKPDIAKLLKNEIINNVSVETVQAIKNQSANIEEKLIEKLNRPIVLETPILRKDVNFLDSRFYQTFKAVKSQEIIASSKSLQGNMTVQHCETYDLYQDYSTNNLDKNTKAVSKSGKKVKNEIVQENNVLKNILNVNKERKGKNDFDHHINNFMTGLNTLKVNQVSDKSSNIVHSNSVTDDVIKSVRYMEMQNIKELTVKVAPKELGELTIKLTVENGLMKANIVTNNESTFHLISSHLSEINQKLVDQNMQIQSFSVNISNNDMSYFSQNNHGNSGQQQNSSKTQYTYDNKEKDIEIESIDLSENNVNILA